MPDEISELNFLKKLCMGFNKLSEIPSLPKRLEVLSINNNKLTQIDPPILDLKNIITLDLSNNKLRNVDTVQALPNLRVL